jgi:alcohol dehydrogenase (cytochrome c)
MASVKKKLLITAAALIAIGAAAGGALYWAFPVRVSIFAGLTRNYILSWSAPKDGHLYGFDLANNNRLYRVPLTQVENVAEAFTFGKDVRFCPGAVGGAEWNSPAYVPETNVVLIGEVDWCDTVTPKDLNQLRRVERGQPWAGMATWNPFWVFGKEGPTAGYWAGWVYAVDADSGTWKWRLKSNYPIVGAMTPTAGCVVFFGDLGGNFYALDTSTGQKLWGQDLGGAIAGGIITYMANGTQRIAVAAGFTHIAWPTKIVTAKVVVLGLDSTSASK